MSSYHQPTLDLGTHTAHQHTARSVHLSLAQRNSHITVFALAKNMNPINQLSDFSHI
jgi:hypothetical protein